MITDERLRQLMQAFGMPDSASLMRAFRQCAMEATLTEREQCAILCDEVAQKHRDYAYARRAAAKCAKAIRGR